MWHDLAFMTADLCASNGPLDDRAAEFIAGVEMAYIATADTDGGCAEVVRQGPPGFIRVIDDRRIAYPETEPLPDGARVGILLIDLGPAGRGLHVNGRAHSVRRDDLPAEVTGPERWVLVDVDETYLHVRATER